MPYRFVLCDVFTDRQFAGNPLAVIPDAVGLSDTQMQQIAREFNFSESTFVLPAERGHTRRVRIFTPHEEIPFAGHPNLGTAFALATSGELGELEKSLSVEFEEDVGVVPIAIQVEAGQPVHCELAAPAPLTLGAEAPQDLVAAALSLAPEDLLTSTHGPVAASVGLEFLFVELASRDALERLRVSPSDVDRLDGVPHAIHAYVCGDDDYDFRARVLIADGGYEDPATGSANCALAALRAHCDPAQSGEFAFRIAQGVEMGRPSTLLARATKQDGKVTRAGIGGSVAMVGSGILDVPTPPGAESPVRLEDPA